MKKTNYKLDSLSEDQLDELNALLESIRTGRSYDASRLSNEQVNTLLPLLNKVVGK